MFSEKTEDGSFITRTLEEEEESIRLQNVTSLLVISLGKKRKANRF